MGLGTLLSASEALVRYRSPRESRTHLDRPVSLVSRRLPIVWTESHCQTASSSRGDLDRPATAHSLSRSVLDGAAIAIGECFHRSLHLSASHTTFLSATVYPRQKRSSEESDPTTTSCGGLVMRTRKWGSSVAAQTSSAFSSFDNRTRAGAPSSLPLVITW